MLGPVFGRMNLLQSFISEPPFFFVRHRIFALILWERVARKVLQENPWQNLPNFVHRKSPTHSCRVSLAQHVVCKTVRARMASIRGNSRATAKRQNYFRNSEPCRVIERIFRSFPRIRGFAPSKRKGVLGNNGDEK